MSRRAALVLAAALAAVAMAIAATSVLFASSSSAAAVAEDATVQLRAEELLSAVTVSRSLLSESLVVGLAYENGELGQASSRRVVETAWASLTEVSTRADALTGALADGGPGVQSAVARFTKAAQTLLTDLEEGRLAPAQGVDSSEVADAFSQLTGLVVEERDERERHIAAVRADVGQVAEAARFVVAFVIPATAIVGFLGFVRRREQRMRLETALLRDQELRESKDEFLTAVAHELRTPLTAVVGFAETLREGRRDLSTGEREELIEILADQAVGSAALVEDLLVFARANIGHLAVRAEVVDVRNVIDKVTLGWSGLDFARLTVKGHAAVWADPLRLRQVMRNLLSNALQHGGDDIEVRITPDPPAASIEVADNGPGIPEELRNRVFEPYQRGDERSGQLATIGLGLTVARSLARLMDGDLSYAYRDGWSVFELTLPAASPTEDRQMAERDRVVPRITGRLAASQITEVISAGRIEIVFQPIVDFNDQNGSPTVVGLEALARFPSGSPREWLYAASRAGLRDELELAAIRSAIAAFAGTPDRLFLSVNTSVETLMSSRFSKALEGISPHRLVLELSEDAIIHNYEVAKDRLGVLTARGYRLAVDDMGTGHTDLWHLVRLRPALVKLDISLIRDIDLEPDKRALVNGLVWLAEGLGVKVIAEGIERKEELERLQRLGVHCGQGYLLGRPARLVDLPDLEPLSVR